MAAPVKDLDALGTLLRSGRSSLGYSQDELCRRLGISQSYLSDLERGPSVPGAELIVQLARELRLDAGAILHAAAARHRPSSVESSAQGA